MQHTLSKNERLGRKEFRRAKWRKRGNTPHFLLFESRNEGCGKRFGVVIQRKIKGAVVRNRIRRSVKEFFRLNKDLFEDCHDYSVRIVRKPERIRWDLISTELRALVAGTRQ
ncbi:MAG TPA: ribonuclease P protein component [Syntrophorhabdales bacterium]|nr:ribonuclease P protein component [Syntrophorhabdales bacterium]